MIDLERRIFNENVILDNLRKSIDSFNGEIAAIEKRKLRVMDGIYYTRRSILQLENELKGE